MLLYGPLCPAYVVGLLACLRSGAVPVPVDAGLSADQYAWAERITRPALVISSDVSTVEQHRGAAGLAELVLESGSGRVVLDASGGRPDPGAYRHSDPDAGYVIPTSGSTGRPKAVVGSRCGLHAFLTWFIEEFALGPHDVCAAATRVSFDPSLRELLAVLAAGGSLMLPEVDAQLDPSALARHLADSGATLAFLVPSLARRTAHALSDLGLDLPALRLGFFAGEPLPGRLIADWSALAPAAEFVNLYGMTEGTLAQLYQRRVRAEDGAGHSVPIGRARPGVSVTIEEPDARGHGEVVVGNDAPALGLILDPADRREGAAAVEPLAGPLHTGDLGFMAPDGSVVVVGRLGDDMKVSGRRVSFHPFVDAVEALPGVSQCVVVDGDGPQAFVAVPGSSEADSELVAQVRDAARRLGLPLPVVHLCRDLPLLRSGKVDRVTLMADAARSADALAETDGLGDRPRGTQNVAEELLGLLGPAGATCDSASFAEAGLTSLELMDFVFAVNRRYGTALTVRDCYDLRDLTGVAAAVEQAREIGSGAALPAEPVSAVSELVELPATTSQTYPLSTRQLAYMAVCMADGNANWCNLSREIIVPGIVTVERAQAAAAVLIARHDVLRLSLDPDGTSLRHLDPENLSCPVLPLLEPSDQSQADPRATDLAAHRARVEQVRAQAVAPLLDPAAPPPLRLALVPGPQTTSVILVGHHLFLDGLSMDLLADELRAALLGRPLGAPPAQRYRTYCTATRRLPRGDTDGPAARYWLDLLAGLKQTELPEAEGDEAQAGELLSRPFGLARSRSAHRAAAAAGVSVFSVVLAAYEQAVAEVFSLGPFAIVVPVQVRGGDYGATAGMFMSQLLLRGDGRGALADRARAFARQLDEGLHHSDFEFDERVEALGGARADIFPLSTILFNQHPKRRGLRPGALGAWRPRALGRNLRYQLQGELQMSGPEMALTYYYRRGIDKDAAGLVHHVHDRVLAALAEAEESRDDDH